jgi:integrase
MKAFSREEFEALISVAEKHSKRDALMYRVMMQHCMRVTEVVGGWAKAKKGERYFHEGITAKSIVNGNFLVVPRLKGSRRIEHPLLTNEKEALLKLAADTPEGPLFPMSRKTAWVKIKKYGIEAGIPASRVFNHACKHTAGRLGYKGGMTVQEIVQRMGHVNPANSLLYSQATMEESNEAFAKAVGA